MSTARPCGDLGLPLLPEAPPSQLLFPDSSDPPGESSDADRDLSARAPITELLITRIGAGLRAEPPASCRSEPLFTPSELSAAASALLQGSALPPDAMAPTLRAYVREQLLIAVIAQDYDAAALWKSAEKRLIADDAEGKRQLESQKARIQAIEDRIFAMRQTASDVRERWAGRMVAFENDKRAKLEEMRVKHESEAKEFEKRWNDRSTLVSFNKPSVALIQLRRQQRQCAIAEDFIRAKELKLRGDELERIETIEAERKASASMNLAYRNLLKKQAQEEEHTQMNWRRQFRNLETERDAELDKIEMCARHLESQASEMRHGKPRPIILPAPAHHPRRRLPDADTPSQQEKLAVMGFAAGDCRRRKRISGRREL
jgi:hypothetical protein